MYPITLLDVRSHQCIEIVILFTAYTNRDLETGIGTPWEVSFQNDYTVLMKGGNLRGYSAVFSIVPELQLGINTFLD